MRARLATGKVVELGKDCGCALHDGPHWVHMDEVDKTLNRRHLETAQRQMASGNVEGAGLSLKAFAEAELVRLQEKRRQMEQRCIQELIREAAEDSAAR